MRYRRRSSVKFGNWWLVGFALALGIATAATTIARRGPIVAVIGAGKVPDPPGARVVTPHYLVKLDCDDAALATSTAILAERYHGLLAQAFGAEPRERLPVISCSDGPSFVRYADLPAVGVFSSAPRFAVISDFRAPREQVLAHELVHSFVQASLPKAPYWLDEGLACELSHALKRSRARPCPAVQARALRDDQIAALANSMASWNELGCRDETSRTQVAAALVRFGMETASWRDLRAAATWQPDTGAFVRWLRARPPTHERFPPILDR